jgi:TIR domain
LSKFRHDALLSYARRDSNTADHVIKILQGSGLNIWRDREQIAPTEYEFPIRIAEALSQSSLMIILLSEDYLNSHYCIQELINALVSTAPKDPMIRVILVDSQQSQQHPIVEISGNLALMFDAPELGTSVTRWLAQSQQFTWTSSADSFDDLARKYLEYISGQVEKFSESAQKFAKNMLANCIDLERVIQFIQQDQFHEAKQLAQEICDTVQNHPEFPGFLRKAGRDRLAFAHSKLGEYEQAVAIRSQEYRDDVKILGHDNFETIAACNSLVSALARNNDAEGALTLGRENLKVIKAKYGNSHAHFQNTANTLGGILLELNQFDDAIEIFDEIVPSATAIPLEQRKDQQWSILLNYGFALMRSGNLFAAQTILMEVVEGYHLLTGEQSIDSAQAEINLAECKLRLENSSAAVELALHAMNTLSQLPVSHPLRVKSAITALQCAELDGQPDVKKALHDDFITPCLEAGGPLAAEVRGFLIENPELVGGESIGDFFMSMMKKPELRIPIEEFTQLKLWMSIAWDGANCDDADCALVIGVACIDDELRVLLIEKLIEIEIDPEKVLFSEQWFSIAAGVKYECFGKKIATRMLDPEIPDDLKERNALKLWEHLHEIVANSQYYLKSSWQQ